MALVRQYAMDDFEFYCDSNPIGRGRDARTRISGRPGDVEVCVSFPIGTVPDDYRGFGRVVGLINSAYGRADFPDEPSKFVEAFRNETGWDIWDGRVTAKLNYVDHVGEEARRLAGRYIEDLHMGSVRTPVAVVVNMLTFGWGITKIADRMKQKFERLVKPNSADVLQAVDAERGLHRRSGDADKVKKVEALARDAYSGLLRFPRGLSIGYKTDGIADANIMRARMIDRFNGL